MPFINSSEATGVARQSATVDVARESTALALTGLVDASLDPSIGSINRMLEFITAWFNGFGCALWQTTPLTDVNSKPLSGELFVLAEYFPAGVRFAMHNLPIEGTWTGEVVSRNKSSNISDVADDSSRSTNTRFVRINEIGCMISVPVQFDEKTLGALNVYRKTNQPAFNGEELTKLEYMASMIPHLYDANRKRVGFQLLREVNEIIREAETQSTMTLKEKRKYLQRICEAVGTTFNALETSIYLAHPAGNPEGYELQATTWEKFVEIETYKPDENDSVTAWILANVKPVRVLNLSGYAAESPKRGDEYPGFVWRRSERFLRLVKELVGGHPHQQPPISFMGTPIVSGDKLLGVIRSCAAKSSPYFFSEADLDLLKLVAAQIAQSWTSWLARRELLEEGAAWQRVVDETNQLNRLVESQLGGQSTEENDLIKSALKTFAKGVEGVDALAIRLWDPENDELYYKTTRGQFWRQGTEKQQKDRLSLRYPIGKGAKSVGAHVYCTKTVYEAKDLQTDPYFQSARRLFFEVKTAICAPISVGGKVEGVLDILFIKGNKVPRHAKAFAELMGKQLGLYISLSRSMNKLRQADLDSKNYVRELELYQAQQQRTFEDLSHQLKGPLRVATSRAVQVARQIKQDPDSIYVDILAIGGLLRKSQRLAQSLHLLADLESTRPLRINLSRLGESEVIRFLIEAAADTSQLAKSQRVHFHVDAESFRILTFQEVRVDRDLLEQAVLNVCDNAAKYSFDDSHVNISGGVTRSGNFHISIANTGLRLRPHEIKNCKIRGWRSADTLMVAGEGSGIGLWIVDHIMKAHGGELIVEPTTSENLTVVKLMFPFAS